MKLTEEALGRVSADAKWAAKYLEKRRIGKASVAVGILILPDRIEALLAHIAALEAENAEGRKLLKRTMEYLLLECNPAPDRAMGARIRAYLGESK